MAARVMRVLVLGGTAQARALAQALHECGGVEVISSLAGRVSAPALPVGSVRIGGFGGSAGLSAWLRDNKIDALVDLTHPFAAQMTQHAVVAAAEVGIPLLIVHRTGWTAQPGDRWTLVPTVSAAAQAVRESAARRVFLTIGRQGVAYFAALPQFFLIRVIDAPTGRIPHKSRILLDRGPFDLNAEIRLIRGEGIDLLVTKNSGGVHTEAKLEACRGEGIPVVMIDRPRLPTGVPVVDGVEGALAWLTTIG